MLDNSEKVVLITGSSRGIGAEIAKKFAECGYKVAINYNKNKNCAQDVCDAINNKGGIAKIFQANVSISDEVQILFDEIKLEWKSVDILVNNAAITQDNLLLMMSESQWDDVINTNLKACFLTSRTAIKDMIHQKFGRILNIASTSGFFGVVGQANYCASKGGVIAMTRSMARELARYNITVNAVAPGYIETDMSNVLVQDNKYKSIVGRIPMARPGRAEEVAALVEFLVSDANSYMTGQTISIDGGLNI